MKTVGIIGGLGPETTAEFYKELVFGCQQQSNVRPSIIIWNVPLPRRIEQEFILTGKGAQQYVPFLLETAKQLEKAGVDFIVMPCNSMHIFIEDIRASVSIPVLSIIEETAKFLEKQNITKVGLLATVATLGSNMHRKIFKDKIEIKTLDAPIQREVGKLINTIVSQEHSRKEKQQLLNIINSFGNNVKHVLLACTDLQLLIPSHPKLKIFDTMKIFADATVDEIVK